MLKVQSRSNVDAANSTNEIFNQLNKELERAQGNTEKLSSDAESLMGDFDKELSENGNFVEAFRKVFNNAYENGVPNEVLLDFLSNPVAEKSFFCESDHQRLPSIYLDLYVGSLEPLYSLSLCDSANHP